MDKEKGKYPLDISDVSNSSNITMEDDLLSITGGTKIEGIEHQSADVISFIIFYYYINL